MDYGVIGNCKSAAVIDKNATIIWCCLPDFDSSSVFASILDKNIGGFFSIEVSEHYKINQQYIKNTNILETTFSSSEGCFQIIDFMPRYKHGVDVYVNPPEVVRYIKHVSGQPKCIFNYKPKLEYAKHNTTTIDCNEYIKSFTKEGNYESVYLYSSIDNKTILNKQTFTITEDNFIVLSYHQKLLAFTMENIILDFEKTKVYWLDWINRTSTFNDYVDEIRRSALILKMLSFQESGAVLAAITTSIPETIGEERNWDYRFCWIRDASMILKVLTKIGHFNDAKNFSKFIFKIVPYKNDQIQIMYGIKGQKELTEITLDWLDGYKGSKPVRIGNAAFFQRQNDVYGLLLDVIEKYIEIYPNEIEAIERLWTITRTIVRNVEEHWKLPDMGIWEFRDKPAHYVFSKVLCWVALDRGVKIAEHIQANEYVKDWSSIREEIKDDIMENGWNEKIKSFSQSYGSDQVDASNLLIADYGFINPKDDKFVSTVQVTKKELCYDDLMYRYKNEDDFGLPKSSFTVCSYWLVKALYQIGEINEAKIIFEKLLSYRNPLGLMSEDLDFKTKELLGNFPQGYSHLAMIDCALSLSDTSDRYENKIIDFVEKNIEPLIIENNIDWS